MTQRQLTRVLAVISAHVVLAWPIRPLEGQTHTAPSRTGALEASGAYLRNLYKHAVAIEFVDSLATCARSGGVSADCRVGTPAERLQHEEVRAALQRGFGTAPKAATLQALLAARSRNANAASTKGGAEAPCGGPLDLPLATVFTVSNMSLANGRAVATVVAHDLTSLAGCPSGITIFEIAVSATAGGGFVSEVKATRHFEGRLEGSRMGRP